MKKIWLIVVLCIFIVSCSSTNSPDSHKQLNKDIEEKTIASGQLVGRIDEDFDFSKGSGIKEITSTQENIDNLVILGKIWGYLKYYHPNVAKGDFNWDYQLFGIIPKVINSNSPYERDEILSSWIKGLGDFERGQAIPKKDVEIKLSPDLSWINGWGLSDDLALQLSNVLNGKRTNSNFYVALDRVGRVELKNEDPYSHFKYPDVGYRMLSLFRYWNIIEYYFPYKNLIEEDWDGVLKTFIPKFINAPNELEYKFCVLQLITMIGDSHAIFNDDYQTIEKYWGTYCAPIEIKFVDNKAVITDFYKIELGQQAGLKIGDIITSIDGRGVENIVEERLKYTPGSNYPTQLRSIAGNLLRTNNVTMEIGYIRDNKKEIAIIDCILLYERRSASKQESFKMISPDIGYIPGTISNQELNKILPQLKDTKGIVIDFRCYPKENIRDNINFSLFLMPEKKETSKLTYGSIENPGLFVMGLRLFYGMRNDNYYKGKVIILANETTQSAAETHVMAFKTAPRATLIGSPTAGANGDIYFIHLPGGITTTASGLGMYYPDGSETQRVGIIPDIEVRPTIEGISANRDELLEKAIEIIRNI